MTAILRLVNGEPVDVELLDPRALLAHPRNVRTELGDLAGLTASIAAQGVLEPLIVVPRPDGGHQLLAGHRRAAAAAAAGVDRVPCVVRPDLAAMDDAGQAEHVAAMLAENLHRQNLTPVEEARGVQTMLDLGIDEAGIAARTGLDRQRVATAAGVARLSAPVAAAVAHAGLTLDQAAVVADFEDAPELVGDLVAAAGEGPGRFAHAVTRAEQDREAAQRLGARRAELERAGRTVLLELAAPAERISGLLHDGQVVDAERHAGCPGAGVYIETAAWRDEVFEVEVCTDPAGNGHVDRWARHTGKGHSMSDEELERQRAERRLVIENNKAMEAANATRRAWIREYLDRRRAPRELLRWCVETLATEPRTVGHWLSEHYYPGETDRDVAEALGLQRPRPSWSLQDTPASLTSGEQVPDARLPLQLFAHIAAAFECAITRESWRERKYHEAQQQVDVAGWLRFLVDQGYTLADVEQQIVDAAS